MVQIQEASKSDLMVRLIAAAARDHGPAVFVLGASAEERLIADVILGYRIPVELVALGADADILRADLTRLYDLDSDRVRSADTLEGALFGKQARITARCGASGNSLPPYEYDAVLGMLRFNPLAGWSEAEVRNCLESRGIGHFVAPPPRAIPAFAERCRIAA